MTLYTQQDAWTPYYTDAKGKGKGPPTTSNVPETTSYGLLFVLVCLAVMIARGWRAQE